MQVPKFGQLSQALPACLIPHQLSNRGSDLIANVVHAGGGTHQLARTRCTTWRASTPLNNRPHLAAHAATQAELVVLFANPDIHFCQMLLEQYRIGVASLHWREPGLGITFSGGLVASAPGLGARSLLTMVDAEVYRAKGDGKNRIYMVDPLAPRDDSPSGDGMLSKEEA